MATKDKQPKAIMLYEDRLGQFMDKLSDEQIGYSVRMARKVWKNMITCEQAVEEAEKKGDPILPFCVDAFCQSATKGAQAYHQQVYKSGIGGSKSALQRIGWSMMQVDEKIKELRNAGYDDEKITQELRNIYYKENERIKSENKVNAMWGPSPNAGMGAPKMPGYTERSDLFGVNR